MEMGEPELEEEDTASIDPETTLSYIVRVFFYLYFLHQI